MPFCTAQRQPSIAVIGFIPTLAILLSSCSSVASSQASSFKASSLVDQIMTVKVKAPCAGKLSDEISLVTLLPQGKESGEFLSRMSELAEKGKAISLDKGDHVLALFENSNFMRVRVLNGRHATERCYIATEFLAP